MSIYTGDYTVTDSDVHNGRIINCPSEIIKGAFYCDSKELTTLEGMPSVVDGTVFVSHNKLTTLHNIHKMCRSVGMVNGGFNVDKNPIMDSMLGLLLIKNIAWVSFWKYGGIIEKILSKNAGKGKSGVLQAQRDLIDAGLEEYAEL